ncbi:MAG: hypothetical protein A2Z96_04000 [Spirochaetes bacterium GWB1_48_6]|nr:MAG: hypothetical protein A2Z96_04000 [Spirochaetes bacterium GWB1_48_6]
MFDDLTFTQVEGTLNQPKLTLMALSTCGFCRKAQGFLEDRGWAYQFIHLDLIDPEIKIKVKEEFFSNFKKVLSYPTLIVGEKDFIVGFVRETWEEKLREIYA